MSSIVKTVVTILIADSRTLDVFYFTFSTLRYIMEDVFPRKDGIDYTSLQLTHEGTYSVTRRRDGEHILSIISSVVPNIHSKSITDATACVGGDTINFALNFREVHSIEYSKDNFDALRHNISVFKFSNVKLYFGDCTTTYNWVSDVLYIDPPWGGPDYREKKELDLFLSHVRLDVWLEDVLSGPYHPSFVFLKVPANYRTTSLQFLPNVKSVRTYRVRTFFLVCISVF